MTAPVGFFAARADGTIVYMNRSLRAVLGVGDDPSLLRVKDIVKEDAVAPGAARPPRLRPVARAHHAERGIDGAGDASVGAVRSGRPTSATARRARWCSSPTPKRRKTRACRARDGAAATTACSRNAPFGVAVLDGIDPASAALLDSNAALMEMTQGRATPSAAFADLFDASEGPSALAHRLRQAMNDPIEIMLATTPPTAVHVHFARSPDGRGIAYVLERLASSANLKRAWRSRRRCARSANWPPASRTTSTIC